MSVKTNSVTKTKAFKEFNQTVIACLVAAQIGVLILAFGMFPTLGVAKVLPLVFTSIGIFLTAIALQLKNEKATAVISLFCILLAAYAHLDGLRVSNEPANCPVETSQTQ